MLGGRHVTDPEMHPGCGKMDAGVQPGCPKPHLGSGDGTEVHLTLVQLFGSEDCAWATTPTAHHVPVSAWSPLPPSHPTRAWDCAGIDTQHNGTCLDVRE